jgi:predicted dehydrogenase
MLDQLCLLMPAAPVDVHARVHGGGGDEVEVHALITVGFADGATGVVETSYINAIAKPRFRVLGTRACYEKHGLDPQEAALRAGDVDAAREDPANHGWLVGDGMRTRVPTVPGRWRSFYDGIRDHLVAGAPNPVPLASVRPAARIIDAAFASARSGAAVRLADPSR